MRSKQFKAWAIHTQQSRDDRYMGYIGVYYLDEWRKVPLHPQCGGIRTAIFRTRAQAREALKKIKNPEWGLKKARVYRVDVTIEGEPA